MDASIEVPLSPRRPTHVDTDACIAAIRGALSYDQRGWDFYRIAPCTLLFPGAPHFTRYPQDFIAVPHELDDAYPCVHSEDGLVVQTEAPDSEEQKRWPLDQAPVVQLYALRGTARRIAYALKSGIFPNDHRVTVYPRTITSERAWYGLPPLSWRDIAFTRGIRVGRVYAHRGDHDDGT